MGTYDIIFYKCVYCGKDTSTQTKLGMCVLKSLKVNSNFDFMDCILEMKSSCEHCRKVNAVIIKDKKILGITEAASANIRETLFGEYYVK